MMEYVENMALPEMKQNQVLIKVKSTTVNRPDIVQRQGHYAPPKGESEVLGLEVAGSVAQVATDERRWKVGDRVMALVGGGGYAEYASAYADHLIPIPDSMTFNQAACVCETYLTAYLNLFLLAGLADHQTVLIHGGGGGVSTSAIHLCQHLVPETKMIVTASPSKLTGVKQLGAHYVIDYQNRSFAEDIQVITSNKGVDVILDHIGGPYLSANMKSLSVGGKLLQIGVSGGIRAELNLALMMVKRQQIIGSVLRSRAIEEKASIIGRFTDEVMPLFAERSIVPLISDVFPLEAAALAHQTMEASRHFGKIVLEVS